MTASGRRVLILVENEPVPFDGRVWSEAMALSADGWQVSVICPDGRGCEVGYELLEGVHIYRYARGPERSGFWGFILEYISAIWRQAGLARKVSRERGFDVIQMCNPPDLLFLVALPYKWFRGIRILFDHHDISPELYEAKFGPNWLVRRALLGAERMSFASADVVISTNESYREIAVARGKVPRERTVVVQTSPDLSRFPPPGPSCDRTLGSCTPLRVGYCGVMAEQDGVDNLLRAAERVIEDADDRIEFVLIGGGPSVTGLQAMARDAGIADSVRFTGFVTWDEVMVELSDCDVCVCPDPKNEYNDRCTMVKILEYMALGKPIVMFDLVEGRRSAEDSALYADANDPASLARQITRLLGDSELRSELGRRGRRRMEESLAWSHQVPRLLEAYEMAVRSPSGSTRGTARTS